MNEKIARDRGQSVSPLDDKIRPQTYDHCGDALSLQALEDISTPVGVGDG